MGQDMGGRVVMATVLYLERDSRLFKQVLEPLADVLCGSEMAGQGRAGQGAKSWGMFPAGCGYPQGLNCTIVFSYIFEPLPPSATVILHWKVDLVQEGSLDESIEFFFRCSFNTFPSTRFPLSERTCCDPEITFCFVPGGLSC